LIPVNPDERQARESPRTVIGLTMWAGTVRDLQSYQRWSRRLNGGNMDGWNDDEPAVTAAACRLVLPHLFRRGPYEPDVAEFVAWLFGHIGPQRYQPEQMEQFICSYLADEAGLTGSQFTPGLRYEIGMTVFVGACSKLDLTDESVSRLVVAAELAAFERGFNPPEAQFP
jgi:hypothetical protein